jgi:hypothetical protein
VAPPDCTAPRWQHALACDMGEFARRLAAAATGGGKRPEFCTYTSDNVSAGLSLVNIIHYPQNPQRFPRTSTCAFYFARKILQNMGREEGS